MPFDMNTIKQRSLTEWQRLKTKWQSLAPREQRAYAIVAGFLTIVFFYSGIWSPFVTHVANVRNEVAREQQTLAWMQVADKQIKKLTANSRSKTNAAISPVALLSLLQKTIHEANLEQNLKQLKQTSNADIEIHFEKVEFDKFITLLTTFVKEQPVAITQLTLVAQNAPGIVNADVVVRP